MKIYRFLSFYILLFYLFTYERCYLFSVIIAIYNAARYLDDSISSLINQTIGLKKIQIILINDGSTDETEEICLKYQNEYKKNIIYLRIEHSGVSKARNIGLKYSNGTFINFLDADDKWDHQAFYFFSIFFKINTDIDFVAGRIKFFEEDDNFHPLDYKFYKTRIVNLNQEYFSIQLSASSSVFRRSSIKGKYFKEDIFFCEDSRFVNNFLLENPIMGIVKESIYYYRRRNDFSSAINKQKKNKEFYFGTLNKVSKFLIKSSKTFYNSILPFIQFLIIYDLLWRIQSHAFFFLNSQDFKKYIFMIEEILREIDDKYIIEQKVFSNIYKIFTLSKKHQRDLRDEFKLVNNSFIYSNNIIIDLKSENSTIEWRIINIKKNTIYFEGIDNLWLPFEKYRYFLKFGDKIFYPTYYQNSRYDFYTMYGLNIKGRTIFFEVPIEIINEPKMFYFYISYMNKNEEIFPSLGLFTHIPSLSNGYFISGKYIMRYYDNRLSIYQYDKKLEKKFELQYCNELKQNGKNNIINLRNYLKHEKKSDEHYEIWIINDEYDKAGDSGEYLFRYLNIKKPKRINVYFAIDKNSNDFTRLKKIGNVLDIKSIKYKRIFLESNKIISSVTESWVDNPFNENIIYVRDLLHFDLIFLNDGIAKNNLPNSLDKFDKNYSLIITSSKNEYKSIVCHNYGYNEDNVILTGLPKFNELSQYKNKITNENKIVLIPTLRERIKGIKDLKSNQSIYNNKIQLIKFFDFYNKLINDEELLTIMKQYNYTGKICLDSSFETDEINFFENEIFNVLENCDIQKELVTASLFLIDYSSIFLEIGYIKKPVIYIHFDYAQFKAKHKQKRIFNYQRDGFGPVCKNIECTTEKIKTEIKNKCLLNKKYMKRIKNFFDFSNDNDRIFLEIIKERKIIGKQTKYNPYKTINAFVLFLLLKFFIYIVKIIIILIFLEKN